jgi:serine/threonine protein kinase
MTECMKRLEKVGEGSYGVVYSGFFKDDESKKVYAVKRNFKEISANWFGNIHEADILVRLKGHPFIVELHRISLGDPFEKERPMTPTTADKRKMLDDKMHFIMEYASMCGDKYLTSPHFSYPNSKIILTQTALALEYMHFKKIIHRDLKPSNILIDFNNGIPYCKICDFGMSCTFVKSEAMTPGVVTCWYRAPEICCGYDDYDYKSDIWSFGCIMFELITGKPWLEGTSDDNIKIINHILSSLEETIPDDDLCYISEKFGGIEKAKLKIHPKNIIKKRTSFESQTGLGRATNRIDFEKKCGKISDFLSLMKNCLQINPEKRPTIKEVLDHKFFDYYRGYINDIRIAYLVNKENFQVIINQSNERKWIMNYAMKIYSSKDNREHRKWGYTSFILFHSINLFERFLSWAFSPKNNRIDIKDTETSKSGKIFNKTESELRFIVCIYVMHKYTSTMKQPMNFCDFIKCFSIPETDNLERTCEDFEYYLLKNAVNYKIFEDTLYEIVDEKESLNDAKIFNMLTFYATTDNYIGSFEGLYNLYKTKFS